MVLVMRDAAAGFGSVVGGCHVIYLLFCWTWTDHPIWENLPLD